MNRFQIEIKSMDKNHISFILCIKPKFVHYILFVIIISTSFFLFLIRFILEPVINVTGFILSIIAIISFIFAIYILRSLTTEFLVKFDYRNLKLSIIKNQIFFFSQKYERSYSGMSFEIESKNPSFLSLYRYFLVKADKFKLPQSTLLDNKFSLNFKKLQEIILKALFLSKRIPKQDQERRISL